MILQVTKWNLNAVNIEISLLMDHTFDHWSYTFDIYDPGSWTTVLIGQSVPNKLGGKPTKQQIQKERDTGKDRQTHKAGALPA